jgi:hypothetical protein
MGSPEFDKHVLKSLAYTLLEDDHGVSEEAYGLLFTVLHQQLTPEEACYITDYVEATDGRFYLPYKLKEGKDVVQGSSV